MRFALLVAVSAALVAGCGSAEESSAPPGTEPRATSFDEARSAEDGTLVEVTGAVYADDGPMRLCDALAESYPPQCGRGIPVAGIGWEALPAVRRASGVTWTDAGIVLRGEMRGGTLHVDGIAQTKTVRGKAPPPPARYGGGSPEEPVTSDR